MWEWKRYVTGLNAEGQSCIIFDQATNVLELPNVRSAEFWMTHEMPVNNTGNEDLGIYPMVHEPPPMGTLFRHIFFPPESASTRSREQMQEFHAQVPIKHLPTESDYAKHPGMHKTDTIDYAVCISGEIWLVTETDEVLLKPGDCAVVRGHNHAWSNRTDKPCLMAGILIDARPLP
jgi:mannose-6-phosphate isomerase-like protein (cupin superfamily)